MGTAHSMAPEPSAGDTLTLASDWYSVAVVLYEAPVGELPFVGLPLDVLTRCSLGRTPWTRGVPASASAAFRRVRQRRSGECVSGVPADLAADMDLFPAAARLTLGLRPRSRARLLVPGQWTSS